MKKFIRNTLLFLIPVLCWFIAEGLLPSSTFTYRPWEALDYQTSFSLDRIFYPNSEIEMESVGQLCHHTEFAIPFEERWKTDKMGNRNDTFYNDPDIVLIGDSFVVGSSLTQDSMLTNQLRRLFNGEIKVYNIAPVEFSKLDYYLAKGIIKKPKLVIYLKSERYVPQGITRYKNTNSLESKIKDVLRSNRNFSRVSIFLDKVFRRYSKNWFQARLSEKKGDGVPGVKESKMFFYNVEAQPYDPNLVSDFDKDLLRTKNNIVTCKNYCDSIGAEFLFIPMPNKATVYYDYVPFKKQPDFVLKLDSMLRAENVSTINTLQLYNNYRKSHNKLLYHLDDTHWNANAVKLVSKEIADKIKTDPFLVAQE